MILQSASERQQMKLCCFPVPTPEATVQAHLRALKQALNHQKHTWPGRGPAVTAGEGPTVVAGAAYGAGSPC